MTEERATTMTLPSGSAGPYDLGGPAGKMVLIAGPCVIESLDHCVSIAGTVKQIADRLAIPYIFKASFDKANRSSIDSYRGVGIDKGLAILSEVKRQVAVPVLSDIHHPEQAKQAAEVLDVIQIPAFLARQTDLLIAAGQTGKSVNVKKAQFMAAWEMSHVRDKLNASGCDSVIFTERGNFFGYNRWVVDMRNMEWMHRLNVPVLIDATHAAAEPGGGGTCSSGQREMGPIIARAGIAAGADGLFLEVHDRPEEALSDAATVLNVSWLTDLLEQCLAIFAAVRK